MEAIHSTAFVPEGCQRPEKRKKKLLGEIRLQSDLFNESAFNEKRYKRTLFTCKAKGHHGGKSAKATKDRLFSSPVYCQTNITGLAPMGV